MPADKFTPPLDGADETGPSPPESQNNPGSGGGGETGLAPPALTTAEISSGLVYTDWWWGAGSFTYSIPGAGANWYYYGAGTQPNNGYSTFTAAEADRFRAAIAIWDSYIAPNFTEVADGASPGNLRAAFTSYDMGAGTWGYAYAPNWHGTGGGGVSGDIWVNASGVGTAFASGSYDFEALLHEVGHAIGLKHTFDAPALPGAYDNIRYSLMSYTMVEIVRSFVDNGSSVSSQGSYVVDATPMVLDIAAVQSRYGADTTTAAGDTTYVFSQSTSYLQTIYDAGGTDTFDLSSFTRACLIDLRPGAYSSMGVWTIAEQTAYWQALIPGVNSWIASQLNQSNTYTWQNNVGIAFATTVENAIGGSAADTITGNDANNTLTGNGGDDTISGGEGNDTLYGNAGANTLDGGNGDDVLNLVGGAADHAYGGAGNDAFLFGADFTTADVVDGGAGINDQVGLQGDYTGARALNIGAGVLTGVEVLAVLAGFSYQITLQDAVVAAGQLLTVYASGLAAGNSLTFNGSAETNGAFMIYGGLGTDTLTGGAGADGFYFGPGRFSATDIVNGGAGTNDQLGLDGDYNITLGANVTNVEVVVMIQKTGLPNNTFNLSTTDAFVTAGQTEIIYGVQVINPLTFNGSAETNGAFRIYGGLGADTLTGGAGADWFRGGAGADAITGNAGADTVFYDDATQSSGTGFDILLGFNFAQDRLDLPGVHDAYAYVAAGALSAASFDADLAAALAGMTAGQAIFFDPTSGTYAGSHFLVVDGNGVAGYQSGADWVIRFDVAAPASPPPDFII